VLFVRGQHFPLLAGRPPKCPRSSGSHRPSAVGYQQPTLAAENGRPPGTHHPRPRKGSNHELPGRSMFPLMDLNRSPRPPTDVRAPGRDHRLGAFRLPSWEFSPPARGSAGLEFPARFYGRKNVGQETLRDVGPAGVAEGFATLQGFAGHHSPFSAWTKLFRRGQGRPVFPRGARSSASWSQAVHRRAGVHRPRRQAGCPSPKTVRGFKEILEGKPRRTWPNRISI